MTDLGSSYYIFYSEVRNPNHNKVCFKSCVLSNKTFSHNALSLVLNAVKGIFPLLLLRDYLNKSH